MSPSKTVPVNMPSSHARILTDRGTRIKLNHTVGRDIPSYLIPCPFAMVSPQPSMVGHIGNLIRESHLLAPLTTELDREISWLGHSRAWEVNEVYFVCDGVWCVVVCVVWSCAGGSWPTLPNRLWPELVFQCFGHLGLILLLRSSFLLVFLQPQTLKPQTLKKPTP